MRKSFLKKASLAVAPAVLAAGIVGLGMQETGTAQLSGSPKKKCTKKDIIWVPT